MTVQTSKRLGRALTYSGFLLPALLLYGLFVLYPLVKGAVFISLNDWRPMYSPIPHFIGFRNFGVLFKDPIFVNAITFTAKFAVATVILANIISLLLAILIESGIRTQGVVRSLVFVPNTLSPIIVAFIWVMMFSGLYPEIVIKLGLPSLDVSWFGTFNLAFVSLTIVFLWQQTGLLMILYIAGLQVVPTQLYEAADMDGASWWTRFSRITLPMIVPIITINLFISITAAFKTFELPLALTRGGPARLTESMTLNTFYEGFRSFNFGMACAKGVILMIIVCLITYLQTRLTNSREVSL
jgi:raffinose/stachyose/melibiose transport system permease protein